VAQLAAVAQQASQARSAQNAKCKAQNAKALSQPEDQVASGLACKDHKNTGLS
jgi:hypothetical protein